MRAVAVNVGANTGEPGFRGPVHPDGSFRFVPIPESRPVRADATVPTYGDLGLDVAGVEAVADRRVHLDPEFAEYPRAEAYTYGDPHPVKAGPLSDLRAGDRVLFYATLTQRGDPADWQPPDWGAYLIGGFVLAVDPLTPDGPADLSPADRERFATNAHLKRDSFDARVLLEGDPDRSGLLDRTVPLSTPDAGTEPNRLVTALSSDSGKGPWWRRPLRFEGDAAAALVEGLAHPPERSSPWWLDG